LCAVEVASPLDTPCPAFSGWSVAVALLYGAFWDLWVPSVFSTVGLNERTPVLGMFASPGVVLLGPGDAVLATALRGTGAGEEDLLTAFVQGDGELALERGGFPQDAGEAALGNGICAHAAGLVARTTGIIGIDAVAHDGGDVARCTKGVLARIGIGKGE